MYKNKTIISVLSNKTKVTGVGNSFYRSLASFPTEQSSLFVNLFTIVVSTIVSANYPTTIVTEVNVPKNKVLPCGWIYKM